MEMHIRDGRQFPYFQVDNRLIDDCELDVHAKMIYVALCRYANNGSKAFPSFQKLADVCNMSKRTVIDRIKILNEKGYIKKESRINESTGADSSNVYTILGVPSAGDAHPPVHEMHPPSAGDAHPPVHEMHPPSAGDAPNKEQVKKNNVKKNNLRSSLVDVPTLIEEEGGREERKQTNEQKMICDLQALNIPTTHAVVETVREWLEEHDVELLQAVIDKCVSTASNGVNLNYLKKAIAALTTKNIKTIEDLERAEELRKQTSKPKYHNRNVRTEVMPTWDKPEQVEDTPESKREFEMTMYLLGKAPHPETGEMNPDPLH